MMALPAGVLAAAVYLPGPAGTRLQAIAASPITVMMPPAANATLLNTQYSSQDVWAGNLVGVQTPPSGISPLQRLANLNPPNVPLVDLPVLRTRFEALDRWRGLCPRWNQSQPAFR